MSQDKQYTNEEMLILLQVLQEEVNLSKELSREEIALFEEADENLEEIAPERKDKHLRHIEALRQQKLSQAPNITSLDAHINEIGLEFDEVLKKLHINRELFFKLELRLISDIPNKVLHIISKILQIDITVLDLYLSQPASAHLAASSDDKPEQDTESWLESVKSSQLSDEDVQFWLNIE